LHSTGGPPLIALLWIARLLALAGFLDATYLTVSHLAGQAVVCGPNGGCDVVLASRYATVGGIPIAAVGAGYYAVASMLAWTPPAAWRPRIAALLAALTGAGFAVSAVLFYLQAVVLDAWCRFCLASAAVTALLFACALLLLRASRQAPPIELTEAPPV
jgi:uncharacterized membrane protein